MTDQPKPRFRPGDVIDIVFRRAVVTDVRASDRFDVVHSDQEFHWFDPDALDVEVTVVGYEPPEEWT